MLHLDDFIAQFNQQTPDLAASEALWDRRAAEVSQFVVGDDDFALQVLAQKLSLRGKRVLEISFGAGRHLARFQQLGAEVSGVEISANMCTFAAEKLGQTGLPWDKSRLVQSSWEAINLKQLQWENAFDLVFMYMSPALSSTAMLQKALDASRHGVYLVLYSYREDSLLLELQQQLGLEKRLLASQSGDDLYLIFNILYGWGYFPQLQFEHRSRTNHHRPDYILERYASWLWRDTPPTDQQRQQLLQLLQQKTGPDGKTPTHSRDIVGHLWLDKTVRR